MVLAHVSIGADMTSMASAKYLIVNADDFGQSSGINHGILTAHCRGIVTSASLMVRWPGALEAAAYAKQHPRLSLGLHVDLGEKVFRSGEWTPLYEVVPMQDASAIRAEITHQLEIFSRLMNRGPSHLDSHQHVHLREPVRTILIETAQRLGVPLRQCSTEIGYRGGFYGQTAEGTPLPNVVSVDGLIRILKTLPSGCTELGCHPAACCDLDTMYRSERLQELRVLCDAHVRAAITAMGIELCSFTNFPRRQAQVVPEGFTSAYFPA
jgi:chitin disaccharide deacetylase